MLTRSGRLKLFVLLETEGKMYLLAALSLPSPQVFSIFKESFSRTIKDSLTLGIRLTLHSVFSKLSHNLLEHRNHPISLFTSFLSPLVSTRHKKIQKFPTGFAMIMSSGLRGYHKILNIQLI